MQYHYGARDLPELVALLPVDTYGIFNNCDVGVFPEYVGGPERVLYPDAYADGTWDTIYGYRRWRVDCSKGTNEEVIENPLKDATLNEMGDYEWPEADWFDYRTIPQQCAEAGDHAILFLGGSLWQTAHLLGFERVLMDMITEPEVVEFCFDRLGEFFVQMTDQTLSAAGGRIDVVCVQDDLGTQQGMMIDRAKYRRFFKPHHQRIFDVAHRHGAKVMLHSCGSVFDFIPEFIEIGVDILDPVQTAAAGMEPAKLVREFGRDICFHGGLDTTGKLVSGTPDDVKREVDMLLEIFDQEHGFILAPSHYLSADAPFENILAFLEHVRSLRS
jgi:uroporphyrinogen decarboxylase